MKNILAIDDSPSIRLMVAHTVRVAGYNVVEASDGLEGLRIAQDGEFDMVITDQNMPGLDGLGLIRTLRKLPKYVKTPIVVLTTEMDEEMKNQGRLAGATGWMVKPFHPDTLLTLVRRAIG